MSLQKIAAWHTGELPANSADNTNNDLQSAANGSFASAYVLPLGGTTYGSAAHPVGSADAAATEPGFLGELHNAHIRTVVADELGPNDSLSYHGMLDVLRAGEGGGMTASKFGTLETLASLMNTPNGISTSAYVEDISHNLIDGNAANAHWTGGNPTPEPLGNLSATSTQQDVHDLIGKWFLGTDLPSIDPNDKIEASYEVQKGPLFAGDGPGYHDANQGALGDCWFVSALGEVALQDPHAIESMITNNHNGTYGVRFFVDGVADYVTVNRELPTADDGSPWDNGSSLVFANGGKGSLWAELVEKAFAQLKAEPGAVHGGPDGAINAYQGIGGGWPGQAVAQITDHDSIEFSSDQLGADAATIGKAFDSGDEVELTTDDGSRAFNEHLYGDHAYEIVGYDAGDDEFTIHNPWGSASSKQMTFTVSASDLGKAGCSMFVTQDPESYAHASAHADVEASLASALAASHGPVGHFLV